MLKMTVVLSISSLLYEVILFQMSQFLPVQQRPSWNSPIQILVSSPRSEKNLQDSNTFPVINVSSAKRKNSFFVSDLNYDLNYYVTKNIVLHISFEKKIIPTDKEMLVLRI